MDLSTIQNHFFSGVATVRDFATKQATALYNSELVGKVSSTWEKSGPTKYLAALPALGTAYLSYKLLSHTVSFKKETIAYLYHKVSAIALLALSSAFSAALASTALGATGVALYASAAALPLVVLAAASAPSGNPRSGRI